MFPTYEWCYMWDFWSWLQNIRDRFDHKRTSKSSWQTTEVTNATAMAEDVDQSKEKPRPPSGGHLLNTQTRISSDTGGLKLNSSIRE